MDLVTIIVPVYNVEPYLEKCVDSLIHQDYKDIEIILVDDGSTDNSGVICDRYSTQYNNIVAIHQRNKGLSGARNTGIVNSNGAFIAFVDSDDWVTRDYISYQIKLVKTYNADIVAVKQLSVWNEKDQYIQGESEKIEVFSAHDAIKEMCYGYKFGASACKLLKREIVEKYLFPIGELYEDLAVMYRMLGECKCVVYSNVSKYYYRRREYSIINQEFNENHLCILKHTKGLRDYINENYPDLLNAAIYKSAYVITQIMPKIIHAKRRDIFVQLKRQMKIYILSVMINREVHLKYKVRCIAIIGGYNITKLENCIEESLKKQFGKSIEL